ncbi:maltose alpha-D-glucosyltransferase [Candidatus Saccharibacteria bacterium]|nr:maltose alpha-D-glucosyltransferase [Candidatus Saccharibacteria bacterium]
MKRIKKLPKLPIFPKSSRSTKRTFAEIFFPARPEQLLEKTYALAYKRLNANNLRVKRWGFANFSNTYYLRWLEAKSMLAGARRQALNYSGKGVMWQKPYARSRPRAALKLASVWYTAYPISTITRHDGSILETLGDEGMWHAFQQIGITALHTGPVKEAGGLNGWKATPSIDGHFDRISTRIDALFGTELEFKTMCQVAARHGGIILDDIIPGHTGKGADFRLAEMGYGNYPGIYHMIEIHKDDWKLLPKVPAGHDSANLSQENETSIKQAGYIVGKFRRVIFFEPGVKETNWSATKVVRGVDGLSRRWVYLHYFKSGQPTLNWLDPSFAGMQVVVGDALHSIGELGSKGLRLDANGFLGVEVGGDSEAAWSEGHPLSKAANQLIAGMVRKLGGFTFQELNLSFEDIASMSDGGTDLSYDFINRPSYHHALATADTEFLRLTLQTSLDLGIDPASLVHALQNHDDLTYELVHFWHLHSDDDYSYHSKTVKGGKLREMIQGDLRTAIATIDISYNLPFTENGIACTTTSAIAAILGYKTIDAIEASDIDRIRKAHLLLAMFNALQPGVFALSGWDLTGAFTLPASQVDSLISGGDTRWINRGAYDLMGNNVAAKESSTGMPKAKALYGTLPEQLKDDASFASGLKSILSVRASYGIDTAYQIDIPQPDNKAILIMVHRKTTDGPIQATVLNFSGVEITSDVMSSYFPVASKVTDMFSEKVLGTVNKDHQVNITLGAYEGTSLIIG